MVEPATFADQISLQMEDVAEARNSLPIHAQGSTSSFRLCNRPVFTNLLASPSRKIALSDRWATDLNLIKTVACSYALIGSESRASCGAICGQYGIRSTAIQFIHDQAKEPGGIRFMSSDCDGLVQNLVQSSAERAPFWALESSVLH